MEKNSLLTFFEIVSNKIKSCFLTKDKVSTVGFLMSNLLNFSPKSQNMAPIKRYYHHTVSKSGDKGLAFSYRNMVAFSAICLLVFSSQMYGQFANVNPPSGGFAIDGGLRANTPTSPLPFTNSQGDWYPGAVGSGSGGSVFDNSGNVVSPATAQTSGRAAVEAYNGSDNVFTNGSKFNDFVSSLRWFENTAPDKNDINNALYHVSRDATNNQWIFISGDRLSTNGTSYIDFELLQGTIVQNANGTFTGTPAENKLNGGGRTLNDIIISMEYTNGGSKPNVLIYQWKGSGNNWSYQQVTPTAPLLANAFAETNRTGAETNLPYSAFGSTSYQQFAFVEAAINISYLLQQSGLACSGLNVQTLWVKTKASASSTAALKDFITPIPVNFSFGNSTITAISPKCASDSTAYLLAATPSGGVFSGPGVSFANSSYYFTPSSAGAGTKTITYVTADGSCTATTDIIVNANPVVYTLSGNSICASAANTGVITLSNSQTGVSYLLKKTSDNSSVLPSQDGTTGASLTWTELPAGVSYYVLATGAAPTNCTSQTGNASVTEVANPVVYTLSGNSICASAANTGVITLSNSQTGISYQLKKSSDNSSVQTAQAGTTGSSLTWTALPAGVNYYVLATGGAPTNCTSQTENAAVTEVASPIVYTLSGNSICVSAPNTGVITLSNSQTGVSYQLKKTSDNSSVQIPQAGTTGSPLTWTTLPAGVNYYVVATGAAPTSCTSQTGNAAVTEVANPVVYTLSGNSICASAPNTGIITLSNSQTGVSYQLKKTSDNSSVQTAQAGTTGSELTWTTLPAGVNYYVVATGAAPTSCTSQTGNAAVTEVANPVVYTLSGNSICASAPNTGVITLSNSQTGVSYQLKKTSDNSSVQTAQAGTTGSPLTWATLPAGVNYYVLATGPAPTSCTSQTGNAAVTEVANPVAYTLSGNSICASAPNTGVITLSNSQTDVSYQLKKTSDNSNVQTAQAGITGSQLTWTTLPAGVNYYVVATGAAPTSCTSQTGNAAVTEVANPVVYTLSGNSICASAPNTGIITLNNSQTGVSYQLKKTSDNSSVQTAQAGTTGSQLTWTALPAGVSYYVLATGAAPTNCTSQTGNASVSEVANPPAPTVTYNAPACNETTFSLTLSSVTNGAIYTVKDKDGNTIDGLFPVSPHTALNGNNIIFSNIPAGSGYQVSVSNNGCGSSASSCPSTAKLISPSAEKTNTVAPIETKIETAGFDAYPVPFKDVLTVKYNFDYVSDVKIEVFNAQGISILSKMDNNSYLNKEIALDLKLSRGKEQVYIVKVTTNRGSSVKKVMSSR